MGQQQFVTMPDGSEYEFDTFDFQYHCIHANVLIEKDDDGDFATCEDCNEDVTTIFDWESHYQYMQDPLGGDGQDD